MHQFRDAFHTIQFLFSLSNSDDGVILFKILNEVIVLVINIIQFIISVHLNIFLQLSLCSEVFKGNKAMVCIIRFAVKKKVLN